MRNDPEVLKEKYKMIEQWKQSGLSQTEYCRQNVITHHSFYYWYKRYRQHHDCSGSNDSSFVKLHIEKPSQSSLLEVHYPGGIRLLFHEIVSVNYLKALLS